MTITGRYIKPCTSDCIDWVIDSGCTQHMCSSRSLFQFLDSHCETKFRVATNGLARATGVETTTFKARLDSGHIGVIRLKDVLYVSILRLNSLSVVQAAKEGASFIFYTRPGSVILQSKRITFTYRPNANHLCILKTAQMDPTMLSVFTKLSLNILYKLFGHTSKKIIIMMLKDQVVDIQAPT